MKPLDSAPRESGSLFLAVSASKLRDDFLPRLERALQEIPDEFLWRADGETTNSVGNLLLHLSGNMRQWVVSGIGGAEDVRRRAEEFSRRNDASKQELLDDLRAAIGEVCDVLETINPSVLTSQFSIQGYRVTGLEAAYHVVEHVSYHLGQVIQTAKRISGTDLRLYPF